jgi:hypothetical protein
MTTRRLSDFISTLAVCAALAISSPSQAATNWNVVRVNHVVLTPPAGVTVAEMSGVTYVGPAGGGSFRFIAAEENKGEIVQFDLGFDAAGAITSINNVAAIHINPTADMEGIAYTNAARNSVFLSDESFPSVREINLANGAVLQTVAIPAIFSSAKRPNLLLESLTRSPDGTVMWTANEQALTVDGPTSTTVSRTTVRLLKMNVAANTVTATAQYAYNVEPIHGPALISEAQSGLSDLVDMPDGTLLALERSLAITSPAYLNRIFEINLTGATDVSAGALGSGLAGQTYTPVSKQLLWSGAADGVTGQNMEGLALGPRLASGKFVLIGVVDNGDGVSGNTIVSFTATANSSADFNGDGQVDGADFLAVQRNLGKTNGAQHSEGDADRDGDIDAADLDCWKTHNGAAPVHPLPEPTAAIQAIAAFAALLLQPRSNAPPGRRR